MFLGHPVISTCPVRFISHRFFWITLNTFDLNLMASDPKIITIEINNPKEAKVDEMGLSVSQTITPNIDEQYEYDIDDSAGSYTSCRSCGHWIFSSYADRERSDD
jgi:hypothetical protein